jgi:hypothetical protein
MQQIYALKINQFKTKIHIRHCEPNLPIYELNINQFQTKIRISNWEPNPANLKNESKPTPCKNPHQQLGAESTELMN